MTKINDKDLLISFKLFLNDKIESERTVISKINRHLSGDDLITNNIEYAVEVLCERNGISFFSVKKHAREMRNDK